MPRGWVAFSAYLPTYGTGTCGSADHFWYRPALVLSPSDRCRFGTVNVRGLVWIGISGRKGLAQTESIPFHRKWQRDGR